MSQFTEDGERWMDERLEQAMKAMHINQVRAEEMTAKANEEKIRNHWRNRLANELVRLSDIIRIK